MYYPLETADIMVGASNNLSETTWKVKMDTKTLAQRYAAFMKHAEFRTQEIDVLKKGLSSFKGDLNVWLRVGDNEQDTGWEIDNGVFPMEKLWGLVPTSTASEALKKWYQNAGADAFVKFGRCIASNTYSYFNTELFGDNASEDMEIYTSICNALSVDPLPSSILQMIAEYEPEFIEISYWLSGSGLLKIGLLIPDPSDELILKTAMITGDGDIEMIAAYEGALGGVTPNSLEISRKGDSINAEWVYTYS
jgi:hypothetical protein